MMKPLQVFNAAAEKKNDQTCCAPQRNPGIQAPGDKLIRHAAEALAGITAEKPSWISGVLNTPAGLVPVVSPVWSRADRWGSIRARISAFRMNYSIKPGLYAIGAPDANSDVFVSANYKLSFDILRRELNGINAWILVLDTKGINVWCAAGKGTFGTDELIRRITAAKLAVILSHRRIIVPQLGATGVRASDIKKKTGFTVHFGPIEARDIKEYLSSKYHATAQMRKVRFTFIQRLILTPMELNPALKKYPLAALIILLIFGLEPSGIIFQSAWLGGWPFLLLCLAGILTGALLTPALLPIIPFRSFALKGGFVGAVIAVPLIFYTPMFGEDAVFLKISALALVLVLSSYLALQFTGATTFTGISGVKKELKFALPAYFTGLAISFLSVVMHKLITWGVV
jgi:hypothetical protein